VLLKHGADPNMMLKAPLLMRQHNAGDASLAAGATPLMRAAKAGDIGMMKSLLEGGADGSKALANGTTAMSLVMAGRGVRALTPDTPIYQGVRMLLDAGVNVNAAGTGGGPLLHQSLDRGEAFVRMLVEHGAKLDLKDATGRTPLDIALGVAPTVVAAPAASSAGRDGRGGAAPSDQIDAATIAYLRQVSK